MTVTFDKQSKDLVLMDSLYRIKGKDCILREQFIRDYIPFIIKVVSKVSGKYVDLKNSDEFSIGLLAFNEAIDSYDMEMNRNFFNFSEQVIKRRIIDYIRSNRKNNKVYPFTYFYNEYDDDFEGCFFKDSYNNIYENLETQLDILLFEQNLKKFGISLEELVLCSPKHKDSKQLAIRIAKRLCSDEQLFSKLLKTKKIPMGDLLKIINVSERTIERNRKFIIAVSLILKSNLNILKGYVEDSGEENDELASPRISTEEDFYCQQQYSHG